MEDKKGYKLEVVITGVTKSDMEKVLDLVVQLVGIGGGTIGGGFVEVGNEEEATDGSKG